MSSEEFQILKISKRTSQINPKQNTSKIIQNKTTYQKVNSNKGGMEMGVSRISKPSTTIFESRRELNQSSLAYAGGKIQLPVRSNVNTQGRAQRTQETKTYKYETGAKTGNNRYSRNQEKQVSSVGKAEIQRYRSTEAQKNFSKRYETSGSPVNRRTGPMTFGNNANFNIKKWAYVSNKDMNKIIILQRWWRYILKRIISKSGRYRRTYAQNSASLRSKSTKSPTCEFLKDFIKQGENITEKVYPGKNNKLVVETRKVEVFKNMKPKSKSRLKIKKAGENITEKIYKGKNNTLINEQRKVEVFNVKQPQIPSDIKMISTESGEYALRVQHSKKYIDKDSKTSAGITYD